MKQRLLTIALLGGFLLISIFAKAQESCGTMHKYQMLVKSDPTYASKFAQGQKLADQMAVSLKSARTQSTPTVYKIPLVFHVLNVGEAIGTGSNISDAQIYSAVAALNEGYRKQAGTRYDGNGADMLIEFCLAQLDPNGNATNGITRTNASSTGNYGLYGITDNNEIALKALNKWDNTKYYNIWLVTQIDTNGGGYGTQGYAYIPPAPASVDGAIMLYNTVGYDPLGTSGFNLKSYTNQNAVCIHEVGHGLGLYHTFEGDESGTCPPAGNQCGMYYGDCVADTPPHKRDSSDCVLRDNACDGNTSSSLYIHNYMNYSSDDCRNEFTAGQAARATAQILSLRSTWFTAANLAACGCTGTTAPIADFYATNTSPCQGVPVQFVDGSVNFPTSYKWVFPGGVPDTSILQNPTVVYNGTGPYSVTMTVTAADGQTSSITRTAYISPNGGFSGTLPFSESFEGTFLPPNWDTLSSITVTPSAWDVLGSKRWVQAAVAGNTSDSYAAAINFYYDEYIENDDLITPSIDFTGVVSPLLTFDVAYAYYSYQGSTYADTLEVLVSTDCGQTYTQLYKKGGATLSTAGIVNPEYVPSQSSDWRTETINLSAYAGQHILITFRGVNGNGNNLYIDNVLFSGTYTVPVAIFTASQTTGVDVNQIITFTNTGSSGDITSYNWNFGVGAMPATATGPGPISVSYDTSGLKTVSMTVTGPGGSNTMTRTGYISVDTTTNKNAPVANFVASQTTGVQFNQVIEFTYTGGTSGNITSYTWNFGAGAVPPTATGQGPQLVSYDSSGLKTVTLIVTGPNGTDTLTQANYISVNPAVNAITSPESLGIKIYPNPTNSTVNVDFGSSNTTGLSVTVLNMVSNQVMEGAQVEQSMVSIDLSSQPQGMYILLIKTANGNLVSRIVKMN